MALRKELGVLKIENEEKILHGDFEADFIFINGGSLTIYGSIEIKYCVFVNKGELIVTDEMDSDGDLILLRASDVSAGTLRVEHIGAEGGTIYGADLTCREIKTVRTSIGAIRCYCYGDINMVDGNLEVDYLEAEDIFSNADIIVHGDAYVSGVNCFNYLVDGKNDSCWIRAMKIFILGKSTSYWLKAAEIFLGVDADLNGREIQATSHFEAGGQVINCSKCRGGRLPKKKDF